MSLDPTRSLPRLIASRREADQEREEALAIRRATSFGVVIWPSFFLLDIYMARVVFPDAPLGRFFLLRLFAESIILLAYFSVRNSTSSLRSNRLWLCSMAYTAAATIGVMAVSLGGLTSVYAHGLSIIALVLAIVVPAPWRLSMRWLVPAAIALPSGTAAGRATYRTRSSPRTGTPFFRRSPEPMTIFAIDTETDLIAPRKTIRSKSGNAVNVSPFEVPDLVLATSYDGEAEPTVTNAADLYYLLTQYPHQFDEYVFHNAAFDIAVLSKAYPPFQRFFVLAAEEGRVHDTMILDLLVRLADGAFDRAIYNPKTKVWAAPPPAFRSLAVLVETWARM